MIGHFDMPWQQLIDPVDGVIGDTGQDIPQVGPRIEAVELCGFDQRQDGGGPLSTSL